MFLFFKQFCLISFILLFFFPGLSQAKKDFSKPVIAILAKGKGRNQKYSYQYQLLELALKKSGYPFILKFSSLEMPEERARKLLIQNRPEVTVMWSGTSKQFEKELRPIYIPTYGGLLGYRLFLINKKNLTTFAKVKSLKDLQKFTAGQGSNWADIKILENAGLKVISAKYHLLFNLLQNQRIDYFPRGVTEIFEELERFQPSYPDLIIDPHILLVYPFASFYFVSKENTRLYEAIYQGLKKAHADGSFLDFFLNHPSTANILKKANLANRIRIDIDNPLLSQKTDSISLRYWFNPSWLKGIF